MRDESIVAASARDAGAILRLLPTILSSLTGTAAVSLATRKAAAEEVLSTSTHDRYSSPKEPQCPRVAPKPERLEALRFSRPTCFVVSVARSPRQPKSPMEAISPSALGLSHL